MKRIVSTFVATTMLVFVLLPAANVFAAATVTLAATALPHAKVGTSYSASVAFTNPGDGTNRWALNGTWTGLPNGIIGQGLASDPNHVLGMLQSSGNFTLSGTPTQAGTYNINLSIDDLHGATASQNFVLYVDGPSSLQINSTSIPAGLVGTPYNASIPYTYNGTNALNATWTGLPPGIIGQGLASDPNHVYGLLGNSVTVLLQGTPTTAGVYSAHLSMTDQYGATADQYFNVIVSTPNSLNITAASLPNGTVGQSYTATIPYTYSGSPCLNATWTGLPSGIIGQGLASNPNSVLGVCGQGNENLTLSGTPTQAGTFTVTLQMTDQGALNVTKTFALAVSSSANSTANQNFQVTTTSLPPGNVGKTYASGIYYTYTGQDALTATFTSLPPGLYTGTCGSSCLTNTGMTPASNGGTGTVYISGTPTQAGNYSVSLYINDPTYVGTASSGISKQFTIQINPAGVANNMTPTSPLFSGPSTVQAGTSASYTFSSWDQDNDGYNGGSLSYSVNWGDNSPVSTQSGFASGAGFTTSHTWTNAGSYQITVTVTPGLGTTVQGSYPVQVTSTVVTPTPTPTTPTPTPTTGSGINLPDGTVIKLPNSATVYLVSGGQLTPFTSAQDFLSKGYTWSQVQQVSPSQVSTTPTNSGSSSGLNTSSFYPYPSGSLVNDGGTVYFIGSGHTKVAFTSSQAFVGLGYSFGNVIQGDLTNYPLSSSYALSSPNIAHPWGSWLISKGTVYYSSQDGLIGVPNSQIFTANGGNWNLLVKANSYDMAASILSPMTVNDTRVVQ